MAFSTFVNLRVSCIFWFVEIDKPLNRDAKFVDEDSVLPLWLSCNTCRGTQHVTGTVSNEATSGMGRED